jgi:hypothetical protein
LNSSPLSLLADESCDFSLIRALRTVGYSVKAIAEICPSLSDEAVLELAVEANIQIPGPNEPDMNVVYFTVGDQDWFSERLMGITPGGYTWS